MANTPTIYQATASAPVNIACIKYWGKRDTALILPTNSSLSITLDQDHLRSTTTSRADSAFEKDRLWLNGKEEQIKIGGRLDVCIRELRKLRKGLEEKDDGHVKLSTYHLHIASYNNFPTAAGLASSASGLAALVSSLAYLYSLPQSPTELSIIARQGSGSACRSLFGGYVAWNAGVREDGSDSVAVQVATRESWDDVHALICVVSDEKKGTSSTAGMQRTVSTSTLLQHRIKNVVPKRMVEIEKAIKERDFNTFAEITIRDSNSFHAVCLDTDPPIFYLNDVSKSIIGLITELNRASVANGGSILAAYTFDAGPNAVIYALQKNIPLIVQLISSYFPQSETFPDPFNIKNDIENSEIPKGFDGNVIVKWHKGAVKNLIHTRVGDGPRKLKVEDSLLGEDGLPKTLK